MVKQSTCIILIDGSNFYFKLKDLKLHNLLAFDFSGFAKMLAGKDRVEYIGFSHRPSVAMVATCSLSRLLTAEELPKFIKKK